MKFKKETTGIIVVIIIMIILFMFVVPIMDVVDAKFDVNDDATIDMVDVQLTFLEIGLTDMTYDMDDNSVINMVDVQLVFINIGNDPEEPTQETIVEWISDITWS